MSRPIKKRTHLAFGNDSGRTEQSHVPDCDINIIMKRALRGQHTPYIREDMGSYGDASSLDYHAAHTLVADANSQFEELPSNIRSRFENNPAQFLEFIQNDANMPEAIELGLIPKPQVGEPPEPDAPIEPSNPQEPTPE